MVGDNVVVQDHRVKRLPRRTTPATERLPGQCPLHCGCQSGCFVGGGGTATFAHSPWYIDQAIVSARQAELTPVLVVNKADLEGADSFVESVAAIYAGIVDIFVVSAVGEVTGERT